MTILGYNTNLILWRWLYRVSMWKGHN